MKWPSFVSYASITFRSTKNCFQSNGPAYFNLHDFKSLLGLSEVVQLLEDGQLGHRRMGQNRGQRGEGSTRFPEQLVKHLDDFVHFRIVDVEFLSDENDPERVDDAQVHHPVEVERDSLKKKVFPVYLPDDRSNFRSKNALFAGFVHRVLHSPSAQMANVLGLIYMTTNTALG